MMHGPRHRPPSAYRKHGFTLIELLVAMAIIALLLGLLMPALAGARRRARLAQCIGQVRQIGLAVNSYAGDYRSHLPVAGRLGRDAVLNRPGLPELLAPYTGTPELFRCPQDRGEEALFPERGTSYEWNTFLNGRLINRATLQIVELTIEPPLLGDAEAFHGERGRNFLYPDGRVTQSLEILIRHE